MKIKFTINFIIYASSSHSSWLFEISHIRIRLLLRNSMRRSDFSHEIGRCFWCSFFRWTREIYRKQSKFFAEICKKSFLILSIVRKYNLKFGLFMCIPKAGQPLEIIY